MLGSLVLLATLLVFGDMANTKALSTARASTENVDDTITYLLDHVAKSDCAFIRNGQVHTGLEASVHFKAKYDHFKPEIKTPEDFIRLTATKSLITGTAYLVKPLTGPAIPCADWLGQALADYRKR